MIACLRLDGKMEAVTELLKPERRKSEKISALSLIIFVGMPVSWLIFAESILKISFKIWSLSACEKERREHCFLLHTSLIFSMLGSQLAYSAILRLLTILAKKIFRICGLLISLSTISSSSVKGSFSLDAILSDKNGLMVFQKVLLSLTFFHQDYYNKPFWIF